MPMSAVRSGIWNVPRSCWTILPRRVSAGLRRRAYDSDCSPSHGFLARAVTAATRCPRPHLRQLRVRLSAVIAVCQYTVRGDAFGALPGAARCTLGHGLLAGPGDDAP